MQGDKSKCRVATRLRCGLIFDDSFKVIAERIVKRDESRLLNFSCSVDSDETGR